MPEPSSSASLLVPVLIFLAAAVVAVPLFRFIGFGAIVGYLIAGIALGPSGTGLVRDPATVLQVAELGVVLLLFLIGLELKPSRLLAMRRDIALVGASQIVLSAVLLGFGAAELLGLSQKAAIVAGIGLAFSATTIALQLLEERGRTQSAYGRRAFAVLLLQDMAVVPVLALMPLMADGSVASTDRSAAVVTILEALGVTAAVVLAGRYALNPFFRILARTGAREVLAAAALLVVLGAALAMASVGMSMALGAFLAGVLLSESDFRHQLEADIEPFRGLLMGLFFMSVGMSVDGTLVLAHAGLIAAAVILVILAKAFILFGLLRITGSRSADSIEVAGLLTSVGEFSFVLFPLATTTGIMTQPEAQLLSALAVMSMMIGPLAAKAAARAADRLRTRRRPEANLEAIESVAKDGVLVIGFGRFAQIAVQILLSENIDVTVIDNSTRRIRDAARFGFKVYYGDGTRLDVLRAAGAEQASIIAVCSDHKEATTAIVELVKSAFPLARVHARAYDRIHAITLLEKGADYQMRETLESAFAFGGATLRALIDDPDRVAETVAAVRRRDAARLELQRTGAFVTPYRPLPAKVEPEPLTKPLTKPRSLSKESAAIVEAPEDSAT